MTDWETAYKALVTVLSQVEQERNTAIEKLDSICRRFKIRECSICDNLVDREKDIICECGGKAVHQTCLSQGICPPEDFIWNYEPEYIDFIHRRLLDCGFINFKFPIKCNKCESFFDSVKDKRHQ